MKLLFLISLLDFSPASRTVISQEAFQALDEIGNCLGPSGAIDLSRVMFLENKSIVIDGPNGPLRASIDGEDLLITELAGSLRKREYFNNIGYQVDQNDDLDVELRLASVKGGLAVYWRETYRNRIYRQGLFAIDVDQLFKAGGRELVPLCSGKGGSHSER